MKRLLFIAGIAALATASFASDQTAEFKAFLKKMEPQVEKAFATKDLSFFDKISTKDFTDSEMGKTMNRADAMKSMKQQFAMVKSCNADIDIVSAKASNNVGVAMTRGKFTMVSKPDAKGKSQTMKMDMTYKETWVKTADGWKIKRIEEAKPMKTAKPSASVSAKG